ncbi:MAG: hydrolase 2, exosortase A system-associated [Candidatus Accumulibacter phosphatis]|uniref:Hydrolase 2, exosortase A system-associated n=3 Tax=Candidatus Accumulibacter TaxID=327159 RepID=A0A7D5SJC6_9PROT|nr:MULTISPECIES: hydrolase 2, exosortase A system-associated [Candidatus Accumulibacter]MBN8518526.1 hydrolase 2, exosortase A system-associated [Accumulibacter sp.]MBO3712632.1 hydrolase 2, exosortase A system-associated [Accumulibacter sp.]MCC2868154.1 hydrolase 2, exosortase A system-associated [Candidatus Accumulibacter phosphatis]MCM8578970.1 hydrolase 2, exosortase A system-associated [Accumulibacter sp.]MCM8620866.1 hydrolase 2, exosortase A system-associated [Accumulibacter sp.]
MQPFIIPAERGTRFCLYHPAANGRTRGAIIYLHPFAEEMNKSRRMAALQARAMARIGYDVLQIDLLGCGDSSGDFAEARWQDWEDDVHLAHRWLRARSDAPVCLWGLRAGCLLAASAAVKLKDTTNFIFWQPVVSGKQHWQQFMRLKMASVLAAGQAKAVSDQLRQQLSTGQAVEIAGYTLAPALVESLEAAELKPPGAIGGRTAWLELSTREGATFSPVSTKCIGHWEAAAYKLDARMVNGPGFWQTSEIEDAPALITATLAVLESWQ